MFLLKETLFRTFRQKSHWLSLNSFRSAYSTHRKKIFSRQLNKNDTSSGSFLKVIGSGASDAPASVILYTKYRRYLFNCGEGVLRHAQDAEVSLSKIDHAFFTQSKWNCIGGVMSLIFRAVTSSTGHPPVLHGPSNLPKIIQRILFLPSLGHKHRFEPESFKTCERLEDDVLTVDSVELKHLNDTAIVYVCKLKKCKGTFSLQKSLDRNVPPPLMVKLLRGENITLDDGMVVMADEVRHPDMPDTFLVG